LSPGFGNPANVTFYTEKVDAPVKLRMVAIDEFSYAVSCSVMRAQSSIALDLSVYIKSYVVFKCCAVEEVLMKFLCFLLNDCSFNYVILTTTHQLLIYFSFVTVLSLH